MPNAPTEGRPVHLLRERRTLVAQLRRGAITRDEYVMAVRGLMAQLEEPDLTRPWWADDLGWFMRAIAQAVHSGVLRDGDHVVCLRREASRFWRTSLSECRCLAVHLESALPSLTARGFDLSRGEVDRLLAAAGDAHPGLVVNLHVQVYFRAARRRRSAVVLDWAQVQAGGAAPRRGDPRGL